MIVFDTKSAKLDTGVWKKFGGSEFLIKPSSDLRFQRSLGKLSAPYRKKIERGTLDPKVAQDNLCKAMAEHIVVGWRHVCSSDGEEVSYTSERCEQALLNNEDLREFVQDISLDLENFKDESDDEAVKS